MSDYTIAAWAIVILAELLLASVAVNVVGVRRRWWTKAGGPPADLVRRIKAITAKAPVVRGLYHRITSDSGAETPAFLDSLQTETKQLQELLQDSTATPKALRPDAYTAMLQPVWQEMHQSYALLHTTMEELLGKTQAPQQLMDKIDAQEQLLQELREQSTTYQTELEDLAQEPQEGQLTSEVLKHLKQRYQMVQGKLQELAVSSQSLTTQEPPPRSFLSSTATCLRPCAPSNWITCGYRKSSTARHHARNGCNRRRPDRKTGSSGSKG
jgi:hypothetical protein